MIVCCYKLSNTHNLSKIYWLNKPIIIVTNYSFIKFSHITRIIILVEQKSFFAKIWNYGFHCKIFIFLNNWNHYLEFSNPTFWKNCSKSWFQEILCRFYTYVLFEMNLPNSMNIRVLDIIKTCVLYDPFLSHNYLMSKPYGHQNDQHWHSIWSC